MPCLRCRALLTRALRARQLKLVQDIVRSVSFFYVFAVLKGVYTKRRGVIGVRANLVLGYLSAVFNLLGTMPFEVCNTRQMTGVCRNGVLSNALELVRAALLPLSQLLWTRCLSPAPCGVSVKSELRTG